MNFRGQGMNIYKKELTMNKRYSVGGFVKSGGNVSGGEFDTLAEAQIQLKEMPRAFNTLASAIIFDHEEGKEVDEWISE